MLWCGSQRPIALLVAMILSPARRLHAAVQRWEPLSGSLSRAGPLERTLAQAICKQLSLWIKDDHLS
jgi:hypothetical protein